MSGYWARGSGPPPPPPGQPPPLPAPPPNFVFSAGTPQISAVYPAGDHRTQFTFRNGDNTTPTFPTHGQMPHQQVPPSPRSYRANGQPRRDRRKTREEKRDFRGRGGYFRGRVRGAHERPLMMTRREVTPERFPGMGEGRDGKFIALDDVSDSDEQDMEFDSLSDRELSADQQADQQAKTEEPEETEQMASIANEPSRKKHVRPANGVQNADNASLPKWSNPDPYTVLPPTEEVQRKKKDVVKLIRKARLLPKKEETSNSIIDNDDFISFNFDDEEKQESDVESSHSRSGGEAVVGAPTGPRSNRVERFSHRDHFQQQHMRPGAPGLATKTLTSSSLPPPPLTGVSNHLLPPRPIPPAQLSEDQSIPPKSGKSSIREVPIDVWPPPDTSAALGNRKRTHDDRIKDESSRDFYRGGGNSALPDGTIVPKWAPRSGSNPTPWCQIDHSRTENFGFWLHKEICDFYEYIRPQNFEQAVRTELVEELRAAVRTKWPDSDILSFGSFAAGLYLPDSDMDLVMVSNSYIREGYPRLHTKNHLHDFRHFIAERDISVIGSTDVVAKAKVPLVKYVDRRTGLKVDVSFENDSGLHAVQTFHSWKATFPAMPIIVSVIKHFLAMRGLNEVFTGGLGGFSVTCLVVSLLQNMPQYASGAFTAEHHLGEVLMEFLDLYGNLLNLNKTAIRVDRPGYIEKRTMLNAPYQSAERQNRLCIIDPHNPDNDLTGGSKNIHTIRRCFSWAYDALQRRMATLRKLDFESRKGQSLLGEIFAGDYGNFDDQRERLGAVFTRSDNRPPTLGLQSTNPAPENGSKGKGPPPRTKQPSLKRKTKGDGTTESDKTEHGKKRSKKKVISLRDRASDFKRQFPEIEGIPSELSKKQRKQMLNHWKSKKAAMEAMEEGQGIEGRKEKAKDKVKTHTALDWDELKAKALSTAGEIVLTPRIDHFRKKLPITHRAGAAKPLAGATRSDPIEVD
ncbi:hypothetical protein FGG08_002777 [Glutinoglossum americanum]|uniref:polynucleotide adenylyltransferase n=1 Tax=Glutinoglossum americanum TaxID=1670608 RepID=A0A9P8IEG9_9PEZI|nr:hypothetical protein FGG08_002777 [Glutinoglossum americanum]